jgi:hypothetical protein
LPSPIKKLDKDIFSVLFFIVREGKSIVAAKMLPEAVCRQTRKKFPD